MEGCSRGGCRSAPGGEPRPGKENHIETNTTSVETARSSCAKREQGKRSDVMLSPRVRAWDGGSESNSVRHIYCVLLEPTET